MEKNERLLAIVLLLQARGKLTAQALARLVGVSVRTIYRDMDTISLAHVPISMDYGPGGGYFLPQGYRLDPSTFTPREARALVLGASMAAQSPLLDSDGLRGAVVKLESLLPEEVREDVRTVAASVLRDERRWGYRPPDTHRLEMLQRAISSRKRAEIRYRRVGRSVTEWREIEPLGLIEKASAWYLAAYCLARGDYRTFRLDRIEELALQEEPANPHPGFNLQAHWEAARDRFEQTIRPLRMVLRLSAHRAYFLPQDHQVVSRETDGRVVVRVGVEDSDAGVSYVLSLGAEAEVLEPEEIRQGVADAVRVLAGVYA